MPPVAAARILGFIGKIARRGGVTPPYGAIKNHHPVGAVIDRPCSHPGICDTTGKRRGRAMLAPTAKGRIAIKIIAPYKNVSARRTHHISTLNSPLLTLR